MNKMIILNREIYPDECIKQAINDYKNICQVIKVENTEDWVKYDFLCKDEEFKEIKNEFCNYLLILRNLKV